MDSRWSLRGTTLLRNGAELLDLANVVSGSEDSYISKGQFAQFVLLRTIEGKRQKILFAGLEPRSEAQQEYERFATELMSRLAHVSPDAQIHTAGARESSAMLALLGLVFIVGGIVSLVVAFSGSEFSTGAATLGVMAIPLGLLLAWSYRSNKTQDRFIVSAEEHARTR